MFASKWKRITSDSCRPIASEDKLFERGSGWLIQTTSGLLHEDISTCLESDIRQMLTDQTNDLVISRRQMGATTFHFSNESRRRHKRFVGRWDVVVFVVTARNNVGRNVAQGGLVNGGSIIGAPLSVSVFLKSHFSGSSSTVVVATAHGGRRELVAAVKVGGGAIIVNHTTRRGWTGARRVTVTPDPLPGRGLRGRHERWARGAKAGRCWTPGLNKATSTRTRPRDGKNALGMKKRSRSRSHDIEDSLHSFGLVLNVRDLQSFLFFLESIW